MAKPGWRRFRASALGLHSTFGFPVAHPLALLYSRPRHAQTASNSCLDRHFRPRSRRCRFLRASQRGDHQRAVARGRRFVLICRGVSLLQQVAHDKGARARRASCAALGDASGWQGLRADEQVGRLRPSLRRHRRTGTARRPGARGAVWLSAGHAVDLDRCHARRWRA